MSDSLDDTALYFNTGRPRGVGVYGPAALMSLRDYLVPQFLGGGQISGCVLRSRHFDGGR